MRGRGRRLAAVLAAALLLAGCTKGQECDTCRSHEECSTGLLCSPFADGRQRCGSGQGETTCRVR